MNYNDQDMVFMPVNINISGKEILIVGGGTVALNKIKRISSYTSAIRIIAKEVSEEVKGLGYGYKEKEYDTTDLGESFMVYACTNCKEVNQQICNDAKAARVLVNVADNPPSSDFVSPAIFRKGHMTVAVGSNGRDVNASIRWRDKIKNYLLRNPID